MSVQRLSYQDIVDDLQWMRSEHHREYLAMYSSWFGGILRDPPFMLIPVDDHLVHHGDGVSETLKLVPGGIYLLERHLDRLERASEALGLSWPVGRSELKEIVLETTRAAGTDWGCLRLFISRGPGDFSPSFAGTVGPQLYVVVTSLSPPSKEGLDQGFRLGTSGPSVQFGSDADAMFSRSQRDVLLAREARERGVDFIVTRDEEGGLGDGAEVSLGIITPQDELVVPPFRRPSGGITVSRVMELARTLSPDAAPAAVEHRSLHKEVLTVAREVLVFGTTLDVLPVVEVDGQTIGDGRPGPWSRCFFELLQRDMEPGCESVTPLKRRV